MYGIGKIIYPGLIFLMALALNACGGGGSSASTYSIGGSVSGLAVNESLVLALQNDTPEQLTVSNNGSFSFKSPLPIGTPYAVSIWTQPSGQTCSVINGNGRVTADGAAATGVVVACKFNTASGNGPHFAFVTNSGDGTESVYMIDATTGALTPVPGSPFAIGGGSSPYPLTPTNNYTNDGKPITDRGSPSIDPGGRFVYVANGSSNTVSAYAIDPITGVLKPVSGSPIPAGAAPGAVVVDPSGRFVYVTNTGDNTESVYAINATTGALTPVAGSPFAIGGAPVFDPTGRFAFVVNSDTGSAAAFSISPATGALAPNAISSLGIEVTPVKVGSTGTAAISGFWFDPYGRFAYISTLEYVGSRSVMFLGKLWGFAIDPTSGALTPLAGFPVGSVSDIVSFTFSPSMGFAYVAGEDRINATPAVLVFSIDAMTGALVPTSLSHASPIYYTLPAAAGATIDPAGRFAYIVTGLNNISTYSIDSTSGALTPVAGSPFATGKYPSLATVDPNSKRVYVPNYLDGTVSAFDVDPITGALTPIAGSPFATGNGPTTVTIR